MSEPTEVEQAAEKKRIRAALDVLGSYYDESTGKIDGRRMMNEIATLKRQCDMLLEALKKYADRQNWGYYDDSGCDKGHGEYTDACFIGPEVAQAVIAAVEGEK